MAKKRKKHNPQKRAQRVLHDVRLWSWESMREDGVRIAHGEARAGFVWRQLNQKQVSTLVQQTNNWVIVCRALCDSGNDTWIESSIRSARDLKVNDFAEVYDEMREEVFAAVQHRHVYDCGWVVQSFNKISKVDNEMLPLIYMGEATQYRRNKWLEAEAEELAADSLANAENRAA